MAFFFLSEFPSLFWWSSSTSHVLRKETMKIILRFCMSGKKKKKDFLPSYLFDSWLNIQFYFRNISFRTLKVLLFIFSLLPVPLLSYLWPFWFLIFFVWPLPSFSLKLLVASLCQTSVFKHFNVICFGRGGTGQQVISLCLRNMFYSSEKLFWIISLILYTSPFLCFILEILFSSNGILTL